MPVNEANLGLMIEVRDHTLALLADIAKPKIYPSQLRDALGYSERTLKKMVGFSNILTAGRTDAISEDTHFLYHASPDADIIFHQEGPNPVYYYGANVTAEHQRELDEHTRLNIAILQNNYRYGSWLSGYTSIALSDSTSPDNIGSSDIYPDHQLLLNFWFTPDVLSGDDILSRLTFSDDMEKNLRFSGTTLRNGLTHFDFAFDGESYADLVAELPRVEGLAKKYSVFLRERGNFTFSIVECGIVTIGGRKHGIYTGSEKIIKL